MARWRAVADQREEGLATALIWTTMSAFLALADSVDSAGITADQAKAIAIDIVDGLAPWQAARHRV